MAGQADRIIRDRLGRKVLSRDKDGLGNEEEYKDTVMAEKGVICGGCWLVDVNKVIDHWPGEEGIAVIGGETLQGGGPGMNLAVNLKRLGADFPVSAVGAVGNDAHGRFILDACARYAIDTAYMHVLAGERTSYTDVLTNQESGKRTFFHSPGANGVLSPSHFPAPLPAGSLLHLGAPGIHPTMDAPWEEEPNGWVAVLKQARKQGLATNMELVSLPAERTAALVKPCLEHLDSLIINDFEAGAVAGLETVQQGQTHVEAVKQAAQLILNMGVREMVAVHFPKGAVVAVPGREVLAMGSVALPAEEILCSVGAGDAFASGLTFGRLQGWDLEDSVRLGHAAAAVNLRSMSTNECLPVAEECLAMVATWGWRSM